MTISQVAAAAKTMLVINSTMEPEPGKNWSLTHALVKGQLTLIHRGISTNLPKVHCGKGKYN